MQECSLQMVYYLMSYDLRDSVKHRVVYNFASFKVFSDVKIGNDFHLLKEYGIVNDAIRAMNKQEFYTKKATYILVTQPNEAQQAMCVNSTLPHHSSMVESLCAILLY